MQPTGKTGRADIALNLINKLYGFERDFKEVGDEHRHGSRQQNSLPVSAQLQTWLDKTQPQGQSHQLPGQHWIKAAVELLARDATVTVTHQVGGVYGALTLHLHYL